MLRQRRRRRRRIIVGTALLSVVLLATGSGYVYLRTRLDGIQRIAVAGLSVDRPGRAVNTLMVGSDAGEARIVMLLGVGAGRDRGTVWSIPADLALLGPGPDPAEAPATVYARGGPSELVAAVRQRLGTVVHHYAELSLDEMGTIVDTVGGVTVAGDDGRACDRLDGSEAVEVLRSVPDPAVLRQQADLVAGTVAAALGTRPLGDFGRFRRLIADGVDEVVLDTTLSNRDLTTIADAFGGEPILRTTAATSASSQPTTALPDPGDIKVRVLNGVRVDGAAARSAAALDAAGFAVTGTGGAGFPAFATTIRYAPDQRRKAEVLASRLTTARIGDEDPRLTEADVTLIVGEDYGGLRTGPPAAIPVEETSPTTVAPPPRRTCA